MSERQTALNGKMMKFQGVSINSGRIAGACCLYSAERHKAVPEYTLANETLVADELNKFDEVLRQCSEELDAIARQVEISVGKAESEIFVTQKHIMNDPKVVDTIKTMVTAERKNIEWAISDVLSGFEDKFAKLDNQYLRERATDIGEIRRRLLDRLGKKVSALVCEGQAHCSRGANRIIVALELSADMVAKMNLDRVLGFVTEHGGVTSHAAIIARSLGVPAVSGIRGIMEFVHCGDRIVIDGDNGEAYLNPDDATVAALIPIEPVESEAVCALGTPPGMTLMANASTMEDVKHAAAVGADGIGLLRTEILFISAERLLGENEQFAYYKKIVEMMGGKSVTFRMLDVGGDKPLSFLRIKKEDNPYLGWRGARYLLGNPDIFTTQMVALGRVSETTPIRVLFPMVIDAAQLRSLLELAHAALSGAGLNRDRIEFGAMFEVPSAFIDAEEILSMIDFASIGSNDLIQYLFAIDRNNELVSQDYKPEHPVLWKMLERLSTVAREMEKPLSICGEMAAREGMQRPLLNIGISILSVAPRLIPRVRNELARYAGLLP
ncbi:MAG: phosphoenolpyruvate--protein phosphotransferase [Chitinispirillaceae bacterium]|nr:phosphoenolpyruvate--protein phosphotransferase [Chitinispirillaceae bacterium]